MIAADGTLEWILDGYTTSDRYPYAQRLRDGTNYMRNSVKVVIDAYDGSLKAYLSAPADPLIRTWARIFPGIFAPLDSMPADLRAHIRYPDDLFRIQTSALRDLSHGCAGDFYHREDQWQIPTVAESTRGGAVHAAHRHAPAGGDEGGVHLHGALHAAREGQPRGVDGGAERRRRVREAAGVPASRQSLVFGPQQIENRINQDTEISRQISLWDQRGSKVIRGDLLVIPIEESLLYVQPLYLRAQGGRIPELKRVVVAYQNRVVMQETLEGGADRAVRRLDPAAQAARARRRRGGGARRHGLPGARRRGAAAYEAALEAQRSIDWARYGEEIRRLGEVLEQLAPGGLRRGGSGWGSASE